jgi:Tir chaperone family protein CesT
MADFQTVKLYVQELDLAIVSEDPAQDILVVEDNERGINNLVIDCEDPLLIFEQMILDVPAHPGDMFRRLLQMNRTLVHGAFALTEDGKRVLFRDTLRLEHLDLNEVQGTIEALSLAMAEHAAELIAFSQR